MDRLMSSFTLVFRMPSWSGDRRKCDLRTWLYGAGTLITVFTRVIGPMRDNTLPLMVVIAVTPAVDTETPD